MEAKEFLMENLPSRKRAGVRRFSRQKDFTELRLRDGAVLSAVTAEGNCFLSESGIRRHGEKGLVCTERDLKETVAALCEGAGYRYFDTLTGGFLTLDCGIRIGIAGEKRGSGSRLPERITSLMLRLPGLFDNAADPFLAMTKGEPLVSTPVVSPPGGGKTTFLRALARRLSRGCAGGPPLRVAVVDPKRELFPAALSREACDVLTGLDKGEGIRRAIQLFNPEVLICDEIGGADDLAAIREAGSSGVVFFASCHAREESEVLAKQGLRALADDGVFRRFLMLEPVPGTRFTQTIRLVKPC